MSAVLLVALLAALSALAGFSWWLRAGAPGQLLVVAVLTAGLAAVGGIRIFADRAADATAGGLWSVVIVLCAVLAVAGGGPLTATVLWLVDRGDTRRRGAPVQEAGEVLRGGAWIGALERTAVFVTLVGGWPEGVAVVLGVKGLGRYSELKAPGTAERFIIGTMVSVLWAVAAAGVSLR